ncbi:MAG: glycogen-binding domain-containing protein [Spirochaetes bacterium]|nr:glycogen-binding domain-containing protein [Spirochaetota bacterium]MBU1079754.1 glycogen-binding domain-containing protein [Spirochaetota bacterium]
MKIRSILAVACALCLVTVRGASAFDVTSVNLHLYLSGLKAARAPVVVEEYLVLSASGPYRYVGAAFSYEGWRTVHSFEINRYGVFVLAVPIPYGESATARYRLVLDGLWAADPSNPMIERDPSTGAAMSLATLPDRPRTVLGVWDPAGEGGASFYFEGAPGQRVTVAGSFNGWDPFIHELEETSPGRYELRLDLPPGEHYYVFVYRGERVADPLNQRLLYGKDGRPVSSLTITASR